MLAAIVGQLAVLLTTNSRWGVEFGQKSSPVCR
jgi:hypothetical protein